jgi:hypothetical protein
VITNNEFSEQGLGDNFNPIRQLIDQAQAQDSLSGKLNEFVACRKHYLHDAIKLPQDKNAELLADFIVRYIRQVPDFIEAISGIAQEAGITDGVEPLLKIARDYFLTPPSIITSASQLEALLDEAYLAHRLLEEVNDRFMSQSGIPLAPMDMTVANIIAHELIGEPFANELDQAVLFSAELLLNEHRFEGENFKRYISTHQHRGWSEELKRWPCLLEDLAISVEFNELSDAHH